MTKAATIERISREIQRESYLTHLDDIILPNAEDQANDPGHDILRRENDARFLCNVLDFTLLAKTTKVVPFVKKFLKGYEANKKFLATYMLMEDLLSITRRLSREYCFDEYVGVFIEACKNLKLYEEPLPWRNTFCDGGIDLLNPSSDTCVRTFNRLVEEIRDILRKSKVSEIRRLRLNKIKVRAENFEGYAGRLIGRYRRLLVLRMDFGYTRGASGADDLAVCKRDWQRLLNNRRSNKLFFGLRGYIWKIERTVAKGFHIQCVWFFDASMRMPSTASILTDQIGQYWSAVITKWVGCYWNRDAGASRFQKLGCLGLGEVRSTDTEKIQYLKNYVIDYLCTSEQYVRPRCVDPRGEQKTQCERCTSMHPRCGPSGRLIGKGELKRSADKNQGAPRKGLSEPVVDRFAGT